MQKKKKKEAELQLKWHEAGPVHWVETSDSVSRRFEFGPDGQLSVSRADFLLELWCLFFRSTDSERDNMWGMDGGCQVKLLDDSRPVAHRVVDSFLNKFFPSGYPYR